MKTEKRKKQLQEINKDGKEENIMRDRVKKKNKDRKDEEKK